MNWGFVVVLFNCLTKNHESSSQYQRVMLGFLELHLLPFIYNLFLQEAQQERSTFISSLMPLLAEHDLQPQVVDAQSIVSSVKVCNFSLQ